MTDQQQRNADIAKAVEHALNQKDIDCREWERQAGQFKAVADAQRTRADAAERRLGELHRAVWVVQDDEGTRYCALCEQLYPDHYHSCTFDQTTPTTDTKEHALILDARTERYAALLAAAEGVVAVGYTEDTVVVGRAEFERLNALTREDSVQ